MGTIVRVECVSSVSVDDADPIDKAGEIARGGNCNSPRPLLSGCASGIPGDGIVRAASISRLRKALRDAMKF